MKNKFQFYKNIILLAASALTLVAVTFAWFSVHFENEISTIETAIGGDLLNVSFYVQQEDEYTVLDGNIELDEITPGSYNKYMMVVDTKTTDPLKMNFGIVDLPSDIDADLSAAVEIRYTLMTAQEHTSTEGVVTYSGKDIIDESNGYVPLSELNDGIIFESVQLGAYQTAGIDKFVIYYEIGLSEDAPNSVGGKSSDLGSVKVSAQRVS